MSRTQQMIELKVYDEMIQSCEVKYDNDTPFHEVTDTLKKMSDVINFGGCCDKFNNFVREKCLDYINESIEMCKKDIPEKFKKDTSEKEWYMEYTIKLLKKTSEDSIRYFKQAYEHYCPFEI